MSLWLWHWPPPRVLIRRIHGQIPVIVVLASFMVWLLGHLSNQSGYTSSSDLKFITLESTQSLQSSTQHSVESSELQGPVLRTGLFVWECDPKLWTSIHPKDGQIGLFRGRPASLGIPRKWCSGIWTEGTGTPWGLSGEQWSYVSLRWCLMDQSNGGGRGLVILFD